MTETMIEKMQKWNDWSKAILLVTAGFATGGMLSLNPLVMIVGTIAFVTSAFCYGITQSILSLSTYRKVEQ